MARNVQVGHRDGHIERDFMRGDLFFVNLSFADLSSAALASLIYSFTVTCKSLKIDTQFTSTVFRSADVKSGNTFSKYLASFQEKVEDSKFSCPS